MKTTFFLTIEEVIVIHDKMIEIGGGTSGLRDIEMLQAAIERPKATFAGAFLYKNTLEMGSALLQSLVKNHPFIDGNKRTAFFSTLRFFEKNNIRLNLKNKEIVYLMIKTDTDSLSVAEIASWFSKRLHKK
ncbi:type II toxin-antitoxin system death-on-curing family toxin [Candidatus Woesebacteria bacterium]|nr:type II toxin-antitoxin system death-on-curing family toxin [Candidatus Woesebacteria bacterium]